MKLRKDQMLNIEGIRNEAKRGELIRWCDSWGVSKKITGWVYRKGYASNGVIAYNTSNGLLISQYSNRDEYYQVESSQAALGKSYEWIKDIMDQVEYMKKFHKPDEMRVSFTCSEMGLPMVSRSGADGLEQTYVPVGNEIYLFSDGNIIRLNGNWYDKAKTEIQNCYILSQEIGTKRFSVIWEGHRDVNQYNVIGKSKDMFADFHNYYEYALTYVRNSSGQGIIYHRDGSTFTVSFDRRGDITEKSDNLKLTKEECRVLVNIASDLAGQKNTIIDNNSITLMSITR